MTPWIFFINGYLCFLRSDCSRMEKEKDEWSERKRRARNLVPLVATYSSAGGRRETRGCIFQGRKTSVTREGISTPHVRHKGQHPLIKCENMTSICFIFLFTFLCLFMPFCIFIFLWSTRVFPLLLRIPQLRWRNQTYVVLWELNIG